MLASVMSIAVYAAPEQRACIARCFALREAALEIAYAIPGYRELDLKDKNRVYDLIRARLEINVGVNKVYDLREFLEEIAADILEGSMQYINEDRAAMLKEAHSLTDDELIRYVLEV